MERVAACMSLCVCPCVCVCVCVGFIVHKALSTIDNSKALEVRMAKLPPAKAFDLYYREVLGDNYNEQVCVCVCVCARASD